MDRGTNETPGSESKGGRQKLHLGPPYKTYMSSPGPGLRLERPKARGTFIRKPLVEKIRVVIIPRGQMKKNIFHRELLTSLRLATGKAKRAANILTSNQQQTLQGLAGTPFVTRGHGYGPAKQG